MGAYAPGRGHATNDVPEAPKGKGGLWANWEGVTPKMAWGGLPEKVAAGGELGELNANSMNEARVKLLKVTS